MSIDFKSLMTAKQLKQISISENTSFKDILTLYGRWLSSKLNRPLTKNDFRTTGRVSSTCIVIYFQNLRNYFETCGGIACPNLTDRDSFLEHIKNITQITENGCWITDYYSTNQNRPKIKYESKKEYLHRVMFSLVKGPIPTGKILLHSCDNPRCFNPDHLKAGTHAENMKEAVERGLLKRGKRVNICHGIKNAYDKEQLLLFIKNNSTITDKDEWIYSRKGSYTKSGYPVISIKGKNYYLHKLVLANKLNKTYEAIDKARHILPDGSKPNAGDLNPDHLFEGTSRDNSLDCIQYKKDVKLTTAKVEIIKNFLLDSCLEKRGSITEAEKILAKKFDVSTDTIRAIRLGKIWRNNA